MDLEPPMPPLIVDAHEDLAWNMLTLGRDYTRSALETRRLEADNLAAQQNGECLLGWPEYQQGNVAIVFSTLFVTPARRVSAEWDTGQSYATFDEARRLYMQQLTAYQRLIDENPEEFFNQSIDTCDKQAKHLIKFKKYPLNLGLRNN